MKSFLFVASALCSLSLAAVPENVQWWNLVVQSDNPALNNQYISAQNGRVGLYNGEKTDPTKASKIFTTTYDAAQTLSLHIADDSRQIALVGSNGLLDLVDVVNPTSESIPAGQAMEWSTFVMADNGAVSVKDGADIPTRRWVSYENADGSFGVSLYDGVTVPQARNLVNVTLVAIRTQ